MLRPEPPGQEGSAEEPGGGLRRLARAVGRSASDGDGELPPLGELLAWLDRHVNLEVAGSAASRHAPPDLERMRQLVAAMGDPQLSYPVLHVTGTNGKGSTSRMCSELLLEQGLTVGTYTSPHLEDVNERLAYGLEPIGDEELAGELEAVRAVERFVLQRHAAGAAPTWFEILTAVGLRWFSDVAVEAAVVEVGLGGRLDATNVADAAVAVLTNVELDHTDVLGSTRLEIAAEKAGIVKRGAVVCCGEDDPAILEVVAARSREAQAEALWVRNVDFGCDANQVAYGGRLVDLRTPGASYGEIFLPVHGAHQGENAAIALAAAEAFFGSPIDRGVVEAAFSRLSLPGRLEVVRRRPLVLLDGAHNRAGAEALGAALEEDFAGVGRLVLVMGCLRGRDPEALLQAIGTDRVALVVACAPPSPRALAAEDVASAARRLGLPARSVDGVSEALEAALAEARPDDLVLVTGSLYVVGSARRAARGLT
ncbi:MAG TPA: Mur ligase family protein, partial [Acidimicrobiales bacterium]|nr:Mur ligase family protein [Acidimicrobiales bacterium]